MRRLALLGACALALLVPAAAEAVTGTVEGTVRPLAWAPEVEVCVVETDTCAVPGAAGTYALHQVPVTGAGARIEFIPSFRSRLLTQYYDHKARLDEATSIVFPPTSGEPVVKGIDADLMEGGTIAGTATDAADGEPLTEVEACAVSTNSSPTKVCGETGPGGEYELHSLAGGTYEVGFWGHGRSAEYQPWFYRDRPSLPQGTPVSIGVGETINGIDATLAKGARINGLVTAAASGSPLPGITVCLFGAGEPKPRRCTFSGEAGEYSFVGLPSGSYQVGFSLHPAEIGVAVTAGEADGFAPQYYDGASSRSEATTIPLLAPATVTSIDAALSAPPAPLAPTPPPFVATPIVPAASPIVEPKPRRKACKRGYLRKKTRKGRIRCAKAVRHKAHRHHTRKRPGRKQAGKKR